VISGRIDSGHAGGHGCAVLHEFISENRDAIIERARARVRSRRCPRPTDTELKNGVPIFLDQLVKVLRNDAPGDADERGPIESSAGHHGASLLESGVTIAQVVHDYGDICQAITELAVALDARIGNEEFRALNLCLDDGIASAVTAYAAQHERAAQAHGTERLGVLAHEMRNYLNNASISFAMLRQGQVAAQGSTAAVVERSLLGLGSLIDRSLAEVRLEAGVEHVEVIRARDLVEDVEIGAVIQAKARHLQFSVDQVDETVTIVGDRQILGGALGNMLQNAFKFTRHHGEVVLRARATAERVCFEVEDECGGLPPGKSADLFRPYEQRGVDRSGVGLGLSICMKAARASGGEIRVEDRPGKGCVFILDLPRRDALDRSHELLDSAHA
jgi:signal transduction histidine kinase